MIDNSHHSSPLSDQLAAVRRWSRILTWCLAGVVAVAAAPDLQANQVYKACGKKWLRKAKTLSTQQWEWLVERRSAELVADLDGDGVDDKILMTSNPSFRDCQIRHNWDLKETTIRVELSSGKTRLFYWINDILAERMLIMRGTGRILVSGMKAGGEGAGKWIDYSSGLPPTVQLVARSEVPGLAPQAVTRTAAVLDD